MKNIKKLIAVILILCMAFSVSGCYYGLGIEETKTMHAIYTDETHKTVLFRDNEYTLFEGEFKYSISHDDSGYITEADVPALLSSMLGEYFYFNYDATVLDVNYDLYGYGIYVRNDLIDEFKQIITSGELDYYCYEVYDSNYNYQKQLADAALTAVINATISGAPLENANFDNMYYENEIYRCDKTASILDSAFELMSDYSGNYYLSAHYGTYLVPVQYTEIIAGISEKNSVIDEYTFEDDLYM